MFKIHYGLILLSYIVLGIYIIGKKIEYMEIKKKISHYNQQYHFLLEHQKEIKEEMECFYREKHNWLNQLIILKHEVEQGWSDNLEKRVEWMIDVAQEKEFLANTGNKYVDLMINTKYSIAKKKGITFDLRTAIPEEMSISSWDLSIVLGGILDNAIEAVSQCTEIEKRIEIVLEVKKCSLIICAKNPFCGEIRIDENNNVKTSKIDFIKHGYGIRSIKEVAGRYDGEVFIDISEDKMFLILVIMNLVELVN